MKPVAANAVILLMAWMTCVLPDDARAVQMSVRETAPLGPGDRAPAFTAESLGGEEIALKDYSGQYVILEFWATWCAPCYPKIPHLRDLWATYGEQGLRIVGVSLDGEARLPDLPTFFDRHGIVWPQVLEGPRIEGDITELYGVVGLPSSYLIGPNGFILAKNLPIEQLVREVRMRLGSPE